MNRLTREINRSNEVKKLKVIVDLLKYLPGTISNDIRKYFDPKINKDESVFKNDELKESVFKNNELIALFSEFEDYTRCLLSDLLLISCIEAGFSESEYKTFLKTELSEADYSSIFMYISDRATPRNSISDLQHKIRLQS